MTIVAHQDDDFLFMNPDIDRGIAAGLPHVAVYITAGDAGEGEHYWRGREVGAKAAYALMAGSDTWVDERVTLDVPGGQVSVTSSYLADHPAVRIYFLRLPDGGGALDPGQDQQLARLESGDLATVTAVDDSATYSRADLVAALTALMTRHSPTEFRLQLHEGDSAPADHTDHLHTAEFSEEALMGYSGGVVTVTHYINYDTRLMPENLTPEESVRALAVMQAYAAHDPYTLTEDGSLQQVYVDWTRRQYISETYTLDTDAPPPVVVFEGGLAPVWDLAGGWEFSLTGPDSHLFAVGTATGALSVQDWFSPSRDDAWDSDGDHIYEVTRLATPQGGGTAIPQAMRFEPAPGGGLVLLSADAVPQPGGTGATGETGSADDQGGPVAGGETTAGDVAVTLARLMAGLGADAGGGDRAVVLATTQPWDEADGFDFVARAPLSPALADAEGTVRTEGSVLMQALGGSGSRWSPAQEAQFLLMMQDTPDAGGGVPDPDSLF